MPDLATRISTFGAYADATVDQVLGPHIEDVQRRSAVTLDHMVFLNRGDHFEAHPLPMEAQLAPAFYAGIADFDGDGNEDVFLSQNFFPTAVGLPRYDDGRGLLLTGDGKGGLTPMSGARSGIVVYGDQRGAAYADYDGDGRLDLVVSQNGCDDAALPQSRREARASRARRRARVESRRRRRAGARRLRRSHGAGARDPGGIRLLVAERRGAGVRSLGNADRGLGALARRWRDANAGSGGRERSRRQALDRSPVHRSTGPPTS